MPNIKPLLWCKSYKQTKSVTEGQKGGRQTDDGQSDLKLRSALLTPQKVQYLKFESAYSN